MVTLPHRRHWPRVPTVSARCRAFVLGLLVAEVLDVLDRDQDQPRSRRESQRLASPQASSRTTQIHRLGGTAGGTGELTAGWSVRGYMSRRTSPRRRVTS